MYGTANGMAHLQIVAGCHSSPELLLELLLGLKVVNLFQLLD